MEKCMRLKKLFPLVLIVFLLTACGRFTGGRTVPVTGNSNAPGQGDESLQRGEVYINSLEIVTGNRFPPDYSLRVRGSLPTPCHQLRDVVDVHTPDSKINVEIYSVFDPGKVCAQALEPFETTITLGTYVRGSHTIIVNGQEVGKITP